MVFFRNCCVTTVFIQSRIKHMLFRGEQERFAPTKITVLGAFGRRYS